MTPEGWTETCVGDLLLGVSTGVSVNSESRPACPPEIGVLKTSAVTYGVFRPQENKAVVCSDLHRARENPRRGCVLLSRMNTPALVGAAAYVSCDWPNLVLPDRIWQLEPNPHDAIGLWLHHFLSASQTRSQLSELASGTSGSMKNLSQEKFLALRLLAPPLPEQRKIAAILSSVDEAIEGTQAVIDQLQVVKKAMMADLLTRGIPGRHKKFKQTEIGEVPEEWEVKAIEDVGSVDAGKARDPQARGTLRPYLRVANVFDGEIRIDDVNEMPFTDAEFDRFVLLSGDVLLNEGQSLELVGRCSLYRNELAKPCAIQNALLRFRSTGEVTAEFAEHYFRWCQYSGRFAEVATQTTSIAHLGLKRFASMRMPVPTLDEQTEIVGVLAAIDQRLRAELADRHAIEDTKSALMSVLLTGEVRVRVDEESAA